MQVATSTIPAPFLNSCMPNIGWLIMHTPSLQQEIGQVQISDFNINQSLDIWSWFFFFHLGTSLTPSYYSPTPGSANREWGLLVTDYCFTSYWENLFQSDRLISTPFMSPLPCTTFDSCGVCGGSGNLCTTPCTYSLSSTTQSNTGSSTTSQSNTGLSTTSQSNTGSITTSTPSHLSNVSKLTISFYLSIFCVFFQLFLWLQPKFTLLIFISVNKKMK